MKRIGTTSAGTHLLELDEAEIQAMTTLIAAAGAITSAAGDPPERPVAAPDTAESKPAPCKVSPFPKRASNAPKPAPIKIKKSTRPPQKRMSKAERRESFAKVQECKGCGADRAKVEWADKGGYCLTCSRIYGRRHYFKKRGLPVPADCRFPNEKPAAPAAAPPHGKDRVRAILKRIQEREIAESGIPHDPYTGQAMRVGSADE
jgi:hypothetical protein